MIPSYDIGTVSVAENGTVVTGNSVIWSGNVKEGDFIVIDGAAMTMVLEVIDYNHIVIPEWRFGAKTDVEYAVYRNVPTRYEARQTVDDVAKLVTALNKEGFIWFVGPAESEPDPSNGDEGQWAYQPSTGKQWHKDGGAWVYDGLYKAFGAPAPYDNGKTYSLNDVATLGGSSYVWINPTPGAGHPPPNATYWAVLAGKGEKGDRGAGYGGTSSSGATIGTGLKYWILPLTYAYEIGSRVRATVPSAPSNWMEGVVTYYAFDGTGNYFVLDVDKTSGSGAHTNWAFSLAGQPAPTLGGTSASSLTLGTGTKAFVTQTTLAYLTGARVRATSASDTSKWMEGPVSYAYGSSALTMNVDKFNGSGTVADWNFNPAGQPGAGDVSTANALSEFSAVAVQAATNIKALSYGGAQTISAAERRQARANAGFKGVQSKNATYTVTQDDYGSLISCTSGNIFIALTAAATLGDGFRFDIENAITSNPAGVANAMVTIDPNGSELINGALSFRIAPGERGTIVCDGGAFHAIGFAGSVHLASGNIAGGAANISIPLPLGFRNATLKLSRVDISGPSAASLAMLVGNPTLLQSSYDQAVIVSDTGGQALQTAGLVGQTFIGVTSPMLAGYGCTAEINLLGYDDPTFFKMITAKATYRATSSYFTRDTNITVTQAMQINNLYFFLSAGTFSSLSYQLIGHRNG